ncbi:hypothetical protein [Rhizobium sp. NXC24]|uniref:hypothetical protein n=1 Tax=Rhizobium sp. NXC24 TaxID=2048897 RepID=UPI000CDF2F56|nr:hypothetical protein [Rhizobium sp. NXC24]AVA24192.1 hypothetical protein NXC24_PB00261 [Rhizobium sp. NXC24]
MVLLSDSTSTSEGCRFGAAGDQPVQFAQRRKIDAWRSHGHAAADHGIDHPPWDRDDDTCRPQNLQKPPCRSFFNTANGNPLAKIRMPAIKNLNFIADMGRINGALELEDAIGSSQEPTRGQKPWLVP